MDNVTVRKEDEDAFSQLRSAVARNCTCEEPTAEYPTPPRCAACKMLTDQRSLDHLLFAKTWAERMGAEEWRKPRRGG
jgi:hypothetical protein